MSLPSPAAPSSAIRFHDERAAQWSAGYDRSVHFARRLSDWRTIIDEHVGAGTRLLDVGCGTGILSAMAARNGAVVSCVDGSPAMLGEARRALAGIAQSARFVEADAGQLPLAGGAFDVVLASSLLEYVPSIDRALDEMRRVSRGGGILACSVPNPHSLYRQFERLSFRLTGRPAYRRHVNEEIYRGDFNARLKSAGFAPFDRRFCGVPPLSGAGRLARVAERHPRTATLIIVLAHAV